MMYHFSREWGAPSSARLLFFTTFCPLPLISMTLYLFSFHFRWLDLPTLFLVVLFVGVPLVCILALFLLLSITFFQGYVHTISIFVPLLFIVLTMSFPYNISLFFLIFVCETYSRIPVLYSFNFGDYVFRIYWFKTAKMFTISEYIFHSKSYHINYYSCKIEKFLPSSNLTILLGDQFFISFAIDTSKSQWQVLFVDF